MRDAPRLPPSFLGQGFQLFKARPGADAHAPRYDDLRLRQGLSLGEASEGTELHPFVGNVGDGFYGQRFDRLLLRRNVPGRTVAI